MKRGSITNEQISKRFKSQFDLVNYAIHVAVDMIETGREPRVKTNKLSKALAAIEEIQCDKEMLSFQETQESQATATS